MSTETKTETKPLLKNTFKHSNGQEWSIRISVRTVRMCRKLEEPINLMDITGAGTGFLDQLTKDPAMIADIAYCACIDLFEQRKITPVMFGESLAGDDLDDLTTVVLEAIADFTQNPRDRAILKKVLKKTNGASNKLRDLMDLQLEDGGAVDQEIERLIAETKAEMEEAKPTSASQAARENLDAKPKKPTLLKSPTGSAGGSGSTQKTTPSANSSG